MKLDDQFDGICGRFLTVQQRYDEMVQAFKAFCDKKHALSALLQPHDPDEAGSEPADGTAPESYPSEADKAAIVKNVAMASAEELARVLEGAHLDLGGLNDERRLMFTSDTILQEAAKRLREGAK